MCTGAVNHLTAVRRTVCLSIGKTTCTATSRAKCICSQRPTYRPQTRDSINSDNANIQWVRNETTIYAVLPMGGSEGGKMQTESMTWFRTRLERNNLMDCTGSSNENPSVNRLVVREGEGALRLVWCCFIHQIWQLDWIEMLLLWRNTEISKKGTSKLKALHQLRVISAYFQERQVLGLERGPLSIVSTTEKEVLERKK
jgi:hypothetical protein